LRHRTADDRGTPFDFVLGQGSVIKGWDRGVFGMCPGEKRKLKVSLLRRARGATHRSLLQRKQLLPLRPLLRCARALGCVPAR
jgi:FKBP-type peptidyl-prolyl cis-trans isomerase 2